MAIATVVTRGYGNGTLVGTIARVVTRGYLRIVLLPPAPADRTVIVLGDRIVEIPNSPRIVEV